MVLLKNFKKYKKVSQVAIFDISSGSIGIALVTFNRNAKPLILFSKRTPTSYKETTNRSVLTKTMLSTLFDSILEFKTNALPLLKKSKDRSVALDDCMFVFSSPWYSMRSKIFMIKPKEGTPTVTITEQFVQQLIQKEIIDFQNSLGHDTVNRHTIIETHIVESKINGYHVENPYGKTGENAQIDVMLSTVPTFLYEKINDIAKQFKKHDSAHFSTSLILLFVMIRDIFHQTSNFTIVEVGSEVTDVVTVERGTLAETTTFDCGRNFLVRETAKRLHTVPEETLGLLRMYFAGNVNISYSVKIKEVLDSLASVWVAHFKESLTTISANVPISRKMFLIADSEFSEWFRDAIHTGSYSDLSFANTLFDITILDNALLEKYCSYDSSNQVRDTFLAIEALYYKKTH